jgi:hypothetical protein
VGGSGDGCFTHLWVNEGNFRVQSERKSNLTLANELPMQCDAVRTKRMRADGRMERMKGLRRKRRCKDGGREREREREESARE